MLIRTVEKYSLQSFLLFYAFAFRCLAYIFLIYFIECKTGAIKLYFTFTFVIFTINFEKMVQYQYVLSSYKVVKTDKMHIKKVLKTDKVCLKEPVKEK